MHTPLWDMQATCSPLVLPTGAVQRAPAATLPSMAAVQHLPSCALTSLLLCLHLVHKEHGTWAESTQAEGTGGQHGVRPEARNKRGVRSDRWSSCQAAPSKGWTSQTMLGPYTLFEEQAGTLAEPSLAVCRPCEHKGPEE